MSKTALLIPCYNAERYLPALKRQIEALQPKFDEVILVDDGSQDRTIEEGRKLGLKIDPLGTNRGPGAARNAAAKKTQAEWIHFFDADDEISPNYLEKVLPLAKDEVDVVLCGCEDLQEKTRKQIMRWEYPDERWRKEPIRGAIQRGVVTVASLIRKTKFDEIGGFNEERRCWEDGDMHLRLALAGARFRAVPDVLCTSIRHARGTSGNRLYCHRCRLAFLKEYARQIPRISREDLIGEIVQTATGLHQEGDEPGVNESLELALQVGWGGPQTGHPLLHLLSKIPSRGWRKLLFRMQMRMRGNQNKP